jgi:hypothetical protein
VSERERALERIEATAVRSCPGCGRAEADWGQPLLIGLPDIGGGVLMDDGIEAYAYTRQRCGYIRLFAA